MGHPRWVRRVFDPDEAVFYLLVGLVGFIVVWVLR